MRKTSLIAAILLPLSVAAQTETWDCATSLTSEDIILVATGNAGAGVGSLNTYGVPRPADFGFKGLARVWHLSDSEFVLNLYPDGSALYGAAGEKGTHTFQCWKR